VRVKALNAPGKYEDGGGLRLVISDTGTKRWVVRLSVSGRRLERGLGSFPNVSLDEVRLAASAFRKAAGDSDGLREEEAKQAR
jgi:hypothetical protein